MADLSMKFCGVNFKNPVVAASATPTRDEECMIECIKAGCGAIVPKTPSPAYLEQVYPSPCYYVMYPEEARRGGWYSLYSSAFLAEWPPEEYLEIVKKVRPVAEEHDCRIIGSVMGGNLDDWKKFTEMYAPVSDVLELNMACPFGGELEGTKGNLISGNPELALKVVEAVREYTDLPLVAKLSAEGGDLEALSKHLAKSGKLAGVHLTHRFGGLEIDIETGKPILSGTASNGYGGPWMAPISRKWCARVAMSTNLDINGGGGIDNWRDSVAFIMAGASIVQICASAMLRGFKVYRETVEGINSFLDAHNYKSLSEIKGMSLPLIKSADEVPRTDTAKADAKVYDPDQCIGCGICEEVCFHHAITVNQIAEMDPAKCSGCGLCSQMCPEKAIRLYLHGEEVPVFWEGARGHMYEAGRKY
ncbi:MAG TPA: 4Fe-4S binding protein [Anaerovoracaceae bacterium]|nr:4Fe-4S binding protein [Anaerovoracaceae bacterium]